MKKYNHSTESFFRKTYARIFTTSIENLTKIKIIMKSIDENEYDYCPENLICAEKSSVIKIGDKDYYNICLVYVYVGKFDEMDMNELSIRCMMENIPIYIWYGNSRDELELMEV